MKTQGIMSLLAAAAVAGLLMLGGCKSNSGTQSAAIVNGQPDNGNGSFDPAEANLAPVSSGSQPTQVMGQSSSYQPQQQAQTYSNGQQAPAPIVQGNSSQNEAYSYNAAPDNEQNYDAGQAAIYADQAPPPLPEYEQPPAPEDDYIWTPGYWSYASAGYYWVPGAWCPPPYYGALWTPPYWGYYGGRYGFHRGYWGPHIGFYGGINYGFGYIGVGYFGGYWRGHDFYYNRAVNNVSVTNIHNVYDRTVVYNNVHYGAQPQNRVSYNGGRGGIEARPQPAELAAMREPHAPPVQAQIQVRTEAQNNRAQFYAQNHGRPEQAVFAKPVVQNAHIGAPPAAAAAQIERSQQIREQNMQLQQRNAAEQQRNVQEQQHNTAVQQRTAEDQQRNHPVQQRGAQEQQHNQQLQQNNAAEQQRNAQAEQQRNAQAEQQRNVQAEQQRQAQAQQQRQVEQQRQVQQVHPQEQPRTEAVPHAQPAPAPRTEPAPRPEPAPRQEAEPRPQPAPREQAAPRPAPAPRAAPAPRTEPSAHPAEAQHGERPH